MTELAMREGNPGVVRLKQRRQRRMLIAAIGLTILVVDALFMWRQGILTGGFSDIPPDLASGLATGILVGCLIFIPLARRMKDCDEHEMRSRRFAAQAGFFVFLIGLPVWSLFAIGGVLPPLNGVAVYASAVVAYLAVFVWHKFR